MPPAEPVRVLFDATRLLARGGLATPTGIDRVDFEYVAALGAAPDVDLRLMVFDLFGPRLLSLAAGERLVAEISTRWRPARTADEAQPAWRQLCGWLAAPPGSVAAPRPGAAAPDPKPSRLNDAASLLRPGFGLRRLAAADGPCVYVNTSHGRLFRKQVPRFLEGAGIPGVFFIHDLIPIEHPEFHRAPEAGRHPARLETVSAHAGCVIVNSEATKSALLKYLGERRLRVPPIEALHLGIDERFKREGAPPPAAAPYFVAVGTIEPRKNHQLLLQVWQRLAAKRGAAAPRLILLGRRGWENERVFGLLDRSPLLAASVAECQDLGDAQVVSLLRGARALLAPSYAEGFGLPVAEGLALGTPVIASDISAHREVGGACAEYLDPLDGSGWSRAIADYTDEPSPRRQAQVERLVQHRTLRWEQHLGAALNLIRDTARARLPRVQRTLSPTSH